MKKNLQKIALAALAIICIAGTSPAFSQSTDKLSILQQKEDLDVLLFALENFHPGLDAFARKDKFDENVEKVKKQMYEGMDRYGYLKITQQLLAGIQCSQTTSNQNNWEAGFKSAYLKKEIFLPFFFKISDGKILSEGSIEDNLIPKGSQILKIGGISAANILDSLKTVAAADGQTPNNQWAQIESSLEKMSSPSLFDLYYPLFFKTEAVLDIEFISLEGESKSCKTGLVSFEERFAKGRAKLGQPTENQWKFEILDNQTAYLKTGTFAKDKITVDYKAFLENAFGQIADKNIPNLILDLGGNSGGDEEIALDLLKHLCTQKLVIGKERKTKMNGIDPSFKSFVQTSDKRLLDGRTGIAIKEAPGGYFVERFGMESMIKIRPYKNLFDKNLYVLSDGANASSAFLLLAAIKSYRLGDIIGSDSGGNLLGTNGDSKFLLTLPNSKIAIDIPAYRLVYEFKGLNPRDKGINPDFPVQIAPKQLAEGVNPALQKAKELIQNGHVTGKAL